MAQRCVMHKESGAALVVVLTVLAISLMLGLAGLQSALVGQQLAGNYRDASLARMGAETAVAQAYADDPQLMASDAFVEIDRAAVDALSWATFTDGYTAFGDQFQQSGSQGSRVVYAYRRFRIEGTDYLVGLGAVLGNNDSAIAQSRPVYAALGEISPQPATRKIDSWR